jgi:hypothetical protein
MLSLDLEQSLALAARVEAAPGQCWHNAVLALFHLHPTAEYVEGWAVTPEGIAIEHGWCELAGRVLDPTLVLVGESGAAARTQYFAGVRYPSEAALQRAGARKKLPFVHYTHRRFGLEHPAYRAACVAALAAASAGLALTER